MNVGESKCNSLIGFLTVVDHADYGLCGGYLVLTPLGRPVEFHCTTPIRPSRAQQILYGPTLEPYLFGEQIGRALVASAKTDPVAIFTDREPVLALRELVDSPVVLVLGDADERATTADDGSAVRFGAGVSPARVTETAMPQNADGALVRPLRIDPPHTMASRVLAFALGRNRLAVPLIAKDDRQIVVTRLAEMAESFDLAEPFERIREAIEEARRGG